MLAFPSPTAFTTAEAHAAGWTESALRHAVRSGRASRLRRGVYTTASATDPVVAAIGAARRYPYAAVSHRSAALLYGLPVLGGLPPVPEVTVPPLGNVTMVSAHGHRATLLPRDTTLVGDTCVTTVARTLVDLARHRPMFTGVAAMDAALHLGLVTTGEVESVLLSCWNWPRIARAQRAWGLADARAESPLESVSRLVIGWLGLPAPASQVRIFDRRGLFVARCDFYWDEFGVFGEADGRGKFTGAADLNAEKDRQDALEDLGLVGVRWRWEHPNRRPQALRVKIENAFARGAARDRSGFPRSWSFRMA